MVNIQYHSAVNESDQCAELSEKFWIRVNAPDSKTPANLSKPQNDDAHTIMRRKQDGDEPQAPQSRCALHPLSATPVVAKPRTSSGGIGVSEIITASPIPLIDGAVSPESYTSLTHSPRSTPPVPLLSRSYQHIREIGTGSFGKALLVKDLSPEANGKQYVIKIIDTALLGAKQRADAINEVQLLASLKHPYIISYKESFVERSCLCIVMDYADGGDLFRAIAMQRARNGHFSETQILRWFTQATLALKYLHEKHILHRDLKSQNLFLMANGRLRLGDFGIAKALDRTSAFTKTQIGTPYYLSPEICKNQPYSWASDIWSLGCILYELATLKVPFDAPNITALLNKITSQTPPQVPETYSDGLRQLCRDCLQREWKRRPSASAILQRDIIQNEIRAMLMEEQRRRRRDVQYDMSPAVSPVAPVTSVASERLYSPCSFPGVVPKEPPSGNAPSLFRAHARETSRERKDFQQYLIAGDQEIPSAPRLTLEPTNSELSRKSTKECLDCSNIISVKQDMRQDTRQHSWRAAKDNPVSHSVVGSKNLEAKEEKTASLPHGCLQQQTKLSKEPKQQLHFARPKQYSHAFWSQSTSADDSPARNSAKNGLNDSEHHKQQPLWSCFTTSAEKSNKENTVIGAKRLGIVVQNTIRQPHTTVRIGHLDNYRAFHGKKNRGQENCMQENNRQQKPKALLPTAVSSCPISSGVKENNLPKTEKGYLRLPRTYVLGASKSRHTTMRCSGFPGSKPTVKETLCGSRYLHPAPRAFRHSTAGGEAALGVSDVRTGEMSKIISSLIGNSNQKPVPKPRETNVVRYQSISCPR